MKEYMDDDYNQRSVITGKMIPRDETWLWITLWRREEAGCPRREQKYDGDVCGLCDRETREFFELPSLGSSSSIFQVCHECAVKMIRRQWPERDLSFMCPVCGFPVMMSGHGVLQCTFGHTWKLTKTERRVVVSERPAFVKGYDYEREVDNDEDGDA